MEKINCKIPYKKVENVYLEDKVFIKANQMQKMQDVFPSGNIPSLPSLFEASTHEKIWEYERVGKILIQYSFLVLNHKNELIVYPRKKGASGQSGHQVTTNRKGTYSALISCKPTLNAPPTCYQDVIFHYEDKIKERQEAKDKKETSFLGLIKNTVDIKANVANSKRKGIKGPVTYWFYVFVVKYHYEGEIFESPAEERGFAPGYIPLEQAWYLFDGNTNRAEIGALNMLAHRLNVSLPFQYIESTNDCKRTVFDKKIGYYIVHAQEDHPFLNELVAVLKTHNVTYWIDDENAIVNDRWKENAQDGIRHANGYILVLGKATLSKDYVKQELEWIYENRKKYPHLPVIILVYEDIEKKYLDLDEYKRIASPITTLDVRGLKGNMLTDRINTITKNNITK